MPSKLCSRHNQLAPVSQLPFSFCIKLEHSERKATYPTPPSSRLQSCQRVAKVLAVLPFILQVSEHNGQLPVASCKQQAVSSKLQVVCCMSYVVRLIRALQHIHTARVAAEAEAQLKMVWATLAASFDNCQLPNRGNVQRATCSRDSFSRLFSSLVLSLFRYCIPALLLCNFVGENA